MYIISYTKYFFKEIISSKISQLVYFELITFVLLFEMKTPFPSLLMCEHLKLSLIYKETGNVF